MTNPAYKVRLLLHDLEKERGLTRLPYLERDILYVINSVAETKRLVASQDIFNHELTQGASRPTIYRALKNLIENNYIAKDSVADRGFFHLAKQD
jgi:hypothetical protein